jgi:hypothetical protein
MDNLAHFHRKKISNLHFARAKRRAVRAEYGEKDTRSGKLLKTISMGQE